jgi:hypothetical protein
MSAAGSNPAPSADIPQYGAPVRSTVPTLLTAALSLALVGCGSSSSSGSADPTPSGPTSPGQSTSAPPTSPSADAQGWVRVNDRSSGLTFALPGTPQTQSRPAAGGFQARQYQVQIGGVEVAVSIEVADHDISPYDVMTVLRAITSGLQQSGATKVGLRDVRAVRSQGMSGYDARISFLSRDRTKVSYWRIRALHDADRIVELQALAFVDPGVPRSGAVDAAFARLKRSLRTG